MRIRFLNVAITLGCMLMSVTPSFGSDGGESGGGGGDILLLNDTIVLADSLIKNKGDAYQLHPDLKAELQRISSIFVYCGAEKSTNPERVSEAKFFDESVLSPLVEYRLTDELPKNCSRVQIDDADVPKGAQKIFAACTKGPFTWLQKENFQKMSQGVARNLREQALLILHERLRANKTDLPDEVLRDITDSVREALVIYQRQLEGDRSDLSDAELATLNQLRHRLIQTGLAGAKASAKELGEWRILKKGGALVSKEAEVSPDAFIGFGTVVGPKSKVGKGTVIARSTIVSPVFEIGDGVKIDSSLINAVEVRIGSGTEIASSAVSGSWMEIGKNVKLTNGSKIASTRMLNINDHAEADRFVLVSSNARTDIGTAARMKNGTVVFSSLDDKWDTVTARVLGFSLQPLVEPLHELSRDQSLSSIHTLYRSTVKIKESAWIDLQDKPVCSKGVLRAKEAVSLSGAGDIRALCSNVSTKEQCRGGAESMDTVVRFRFVTADKIYKALAGGLNHLPAWYFGWACPKAELRAYSEQICKTEQGCFSKEWIGYIEEQLKKHDPVLYQIPSRMACLRENVVFE